MVKNSSSAASPDKRGNADEALDPRSNPVTRSRSKPAPAIEGRPVHLLENWARAAARLRAAKLIALFMDFDGTLAPVQSRPQRVRLPHDTRRALSRLAQHPKVRMWVITGRLRADVQRRVNVDGVQCLGLHGWDGGHGALLNLKAFQSLRSAKREIRGRLRGLSGVWIEDKDPVFAVHYRDASSVAALPVAAAVREVVGPLATDLRLLKGLKVWEVLPRGFKGKGAAITALAARLPPDALAIYLGDDATDEAGFAALPKGLTARVGTRRTTAARFYLRDPEEVTSFLERMEKAIR
jgi:trehalose 6-phosphate phosphatase